ncbi:uncharacterized protein LOC124112669 [Haliotis rufescens]|uniref:uncharacterized protein LOC124112669 n=1 Tax=Haliotis rufescens TaxID=6454 RepID=UPI00201EEB2F|nr:uncharacterized protein LOC124112669 [Haliotis rufescens]
MCQFSTKSCCDWSQLCLLPCLHSACKPCIDHQVTQAKQNYIQCPSCGREFNMEQTAVDHVGRNEAAYTANVDGEKKCNYIEGDHDAKAVMYCHECDDRLCYDCLKLHNRLKRNRTHRMGEINLAANIPIKHWLKQPNCRDHPDNKLQLYDHTCKQAICLVCDRGAHKDHKNEDVNHAYVEAKGQLREQVQKQRLKLKDVTVRMTTVNSHQNELGNKQRKLEQDATTVFQSVAVRFLHRQRQLMKDIHASLQAPNEMVKEKLDTLHDVHTSIESTIDYTQRTLESTRQGELITLTGVLQKKSDENLKRKLPEDNTHDTRVLLSFQGQKALMELIDTFGGLASSLDLDHFPDKQPTLQDLHKQNKQLALKEEETSAVHEGRWHRLGEMIRRITGSATSGDGSQGLQPEQLTPQDLRHEQLTQQERRPQQLTPQEVYEVTCFILGASFLSESPSRGLLLRGYSSPIHIINKNRSVIFITCSSDLVYVNKEKVEAHHKKQLAEKDGQIAGMHSAMERLEEQVKQKDTDYAELEEQLIKERGDLTTQIEKKNEEVEAVKTKLSKANDELLHIRAKCETVEKRLQEEEEAYDAVLGVPRSQSPDRVHVREEVHQADSTERMCQFTTQSCCDGSQLCLLPCLHSACKPCIDHQVTQAKQNCIQCPSCGREFNMEQTAVDHVGRNEAAYTANVDGDKKCNYIEGHHDAKAVMYCHECDDLLCSDCHKLHKTPKRNRTHRVSEINQAENIPMKQWLKEPNCRDHPDNKLQLYDHTCKQAICLVCDRGAHKGHENEDMNHAYVEAKGQLEEQVQQQRLKLKDVTDRMGTVTSHHNELGNKQRKLEQDATTVFKSVAVRFLHRQRQLMKDIHACLQAPNKMVKENLDTLHDVHTSIVSTIDYSQRTLQSTRQEELIILTGVLQKKSDENLKRKLPEDDTQDTRVLLSFQGQKALMELIDTFGGLASSLDLDHIPDKQPTLQDLNKQNKQLALKEEETSAVHEGRWHRLGEMIRRITGSATSGDGSQGLRPEQLTSQGLRPEQLTPQDLRPQQLTSQEVYEVVTRFILGASILSESPTRGLYLRGYSGAIHIISKNRSVIFITCPKLHLAAPRANTYWCHVTTDDELVNSRPATQPTFHRGRLIYAFGKCTSTPIPLDLSPSSVTPAPNTARYWETHSRVGVVSALYESPVLDMGVVEESQDSGTYFYQQRRSWGVSVRSCTRHSGSICTGVWQEVEKGKCYRNTMSDTPGKQATLHYGVVLDVGRGRVAFIDLDREVVLAKADVEFRGALLPVFGVGTANGFTVNMKLISGEEIVMTDTKRSLINEALP